MTAYSVTGSYGSYADSPILAVKAGLYELRITQVAFVSTAVDAEQTTMMRWETSTFTGGSTKEIIPMRDGAPPASATARNGAVTLPAGYKVLAYQMLAPGANRTWTSNYAQITETSGSAAQFQPALDVTIAPGHSFAAYAWVNTAGSILATIYFEELRLSWTY